MLHAWECWHQNAQGVFEHLAHRVDKMVGLIANQIFPNKKIVVGQILEAEVHGVKLQYAQV